MKVVTKEQVDALFQIEAVFFGRVDGVLISDAAALFGVEAVKYALNGGSGLHGVWYSGDDRLLYLTLEGFRFAASVHNAHQHLQHGSMARGDEEAGQEEDRAATVQSSAEQSKDK